VDAPEAPPPAPVAAVDPGADETAPPRVEATQPAAPRRPLSSDMPGIDTTPVARVAPALPAAENRSASFDGTAPLRLAELAPASRRELPPLKLTMHMWNEAAAQRFVIVDGRRLVEGDRLGAVQVAEIRRDGVLLDWNGRPLLLPLR
jgi:general secretion pathway protein B